jgi:ribosome-interacting GTPase 1
MFIISVIRFSDDIVLLAINEHDLEKTLVEMGRCFEKYNLIINRRKTKVMMYQKFD